MMCTDLLNSPPRLSRSSWPSWRLHLKSRGFTLTVANGIVTSFLTSNDDISNLFALLPSFRCQLDLPIPIEHLQQATGRVSKTQRVSSPEQKIVQTRTVLGPWRLTRHKYRCRVYRRGRCSACLSKDQGAVQQIRCLRKLLDSLPCCHLLSDCGTGVETGTHDRTLWPSIDRF